MTQFLNRKAKLFLLLSGLSLSTVVWIQPIRTQAANLLLRNADVNNPETLYERSAFDSFQIVKSKDDSSLSFQKQRGGTGSKPSGGNGSSESQSIKGRGGTPSKPSGGNGNNSGQGNNKKPKNGLCILLQRNTLTCP